MTYKVNIIENVDLLEADNDNIFDQKPTDIYQIQEHIKNQLKINIKVTLEKIAQQEADEQIGALRYERGSTTRIDSRNGTRNRNVSTSMGSFDIKVPRARSIPLTFSVFEKYKRKWRELDQILLDSHIGGLSCRDAGGRLAKLLGGEFSGATIAKLKDALAENLKKFKHEPLNDEYMAIVLDGMFVRIKQCDGVKRPLVVAIGIKANGDEVLLGMRVCYSENGTEVSALLRSIKERGVRGVHLEVITIDGDKGLEAGVTSVYGTVRIQSCTFHKMNRLHSNAVSKKRGKIMMKEAAVIFKEENIRKQKQDLKDFGAKWTEKEPRSIRLFEKDLHRCFEVNILPKELRRKASTSGRCEGFFQQLRKRIKSIGAFETPQAVELYVYGITCQKKWLHIPGRSINDPLLYKSTHSS
ncbi:MAG: IS256 family transposase [Kiritimatiellae bacterium]|nr:IS256 family transposase [Kiritimatiellia bacterium]